MTNSFAGAGAGPLTSVSAEANTEPNVDPDKRIDATQTAQRLECRLVRSCKGGAPNSGNAHPLLVPHKNAVEERVLRSQILRIHSKMTRKLFFYYYT